MLLGASSGPLRVRPGLLPHRFRISSPPSLVSLPLGESGQWWELSDDTRGGLSYYYHTLTGETRWEKPEDEFVIPLRVIQVLSSVSPHLTEHTDSSHAAIDYYTRSEAVSDRNVQTHE